VKIRFILKKHGFPKETDLNKIRLNPNSSRNETCLKGWYMYLKLCRVGFKHDNVSIRIQSQEFLEIGTCHIGTYYVKRGHHKRTNILSHVRNEHAFVHASPNDTKFRQDKSTWAATNVTMRTALLLTVKVGPSIHIFIYNVKSDEIVRPSPVRLLLAQVMVSTEPKRHMLRTLLLRRI
jgi:hypothetical protein